MEDKQNKCKVCGEETDSVLNIHFKAVFICDYCCNMITLQQVTHLTHENMGCFDKLKETK